MLMKQELRSWELIAPARPALALRPLSRHATVSQIYAELKSESLLAGFESFLIGLIPSHKDGKILQSVLLTDLQPFELAQFEENEQIDYAPVFSRLAESTAPFRWSIEAQDSQAALSGYCLPLHAHDGQRGYALFSAPGCSADNDPTRLTLTVMELYDRLVTLSKDDSGPSEPAVSSREIECLRWAAQGKSSSEIATIIDLSEHTVNHYLIACCRKLDAVNRVQAVAKAVRLGLI